MDDEPMDDELRKQLRDVDWVLVLHRGATLVRMLRGDRSQDVDADTTVEKRRALTMRGTVDGIARAFVGCTRRDDCDCPLHREERANGE